MNLKYKLLMSVLILAMGVSQAQAQRFPRLSDLRLPKPAESNDGPSDRQKGLGTAAGCAAGGAAGWAIGDRVMRRLPERMRRQTQQAIFVSATLGCIVGGTAARKIITNMQDSAKQAQEEAWVVAQAQTDPVEWSDPNSDYSGTVELVEIEQLPDGQKCGTRRNFVKADAGEAENFVRVCEDESGAYVPIEV